MYAIFVDLYVILNYNRLHDVYNGMFDSSSSQIIEYNSGIWCFSSQHTEKKDQRLIMFKFGDMFSCGVLITLLSNIQIKKSALVKY
jgi:hypothetical protein